MEKNPHYFWAIRIPNDVQQAIHDELLQIKHIFEFKRWVDLHDYHITLAFLGSVDSKQLQTVIRLVGDAIKNEKSFMLDIKGLNVFGAPKSPRIFWAAVNEEPSLFQLQEIVHKTCLAAGFSLDNRPYNPHITLARKWGKDGDFQMDELDAHNPFKANALPFCASEVVLYKTNLEKTPKYEPVVAFSLVE